MRSKILIGIAVVLAVLAIVVATRPSTFHVERSMVIATPPERPFSEVNDFRKWADWSPYDKLDPAMKRSYSGAASGVGAEYAWEGNDKTGQGRMTITTSEPSSRIGIELQFIKPFAATNTATFTFTPDAGGTKVTWAMDGHNGFIGKAMCMVMDMDSLAGRDFERGLASLKSVSESAPTQGPTPGASPQGPAP